MHRLGRRRDRIGHSGKGSGDFTVLIGTQSNGPGHETAYAQVVSHYLDVPLSRIKVVQGDTDRVASGAGTGGSRSIPIGAVMVDRASRKLVAVAEGPCGRQARSRGSRSRNRRRAHPHRRHGPRHLLRRARGAARRHRRAADRGRIASRRRDATYPNGTHICEVEIDPETGTDAHRALHDRRRFRLHPQPAAARGPGPWRRSRRARARR